MLRIYNIVLIEAKEQGGLIMKLDGSIRRAGCLVLIMAVVYLFFLALLASDSDFSCAVYTKLGELLDLEPGC